MWFMFLYVSLSCLMLANNVLQGLWSWLLYHLMDTFFALARYKGERLLLQFTVLSSQEMFLNEVCERWTLDTSQVRVKFVTPNSYKMICPIELAKDFQRMCHIHHMFGKNIVDLIVDNVNQIVDVPGAIFPSANILVCYLRAVITFTMYYLEFLCIIWCFYLL